MDNIEIYYDELKRNESHIDDIAFYILLNTIFNQNKDIYSQIYVSDYEQLYYLWPYYRVFSFCMSAK